jgi:hypothetical protein
MGTGIPPADLAAAEKIGVEYSDRLYQKLSLERLPPELVPPDPIEWAKRHGKALLAFADDAPISPGATFCLTGHTPLYSVADGLTPVLDILPEQTVVSFLGVEGQFVHVRTEKATGYISGGATVKKFDGQMPISLAAPVPLVHEVPPEEDEPGLTPMYESPDGWSRIVARLPHDIAIKSATPEGNFVRVVTIDNTVGYVARSAQLKALSGVQAG